MNRSYRRRLLIRHWVLFAICSVMSFGSLHCSPPPICDGTVGTQTIDPSDSPCEKDCECNNQNYEGYCNENATCVSKKRESCENPGEKRICTLFQPAENCTIGSQICQPDELLSRKWGDCTPIKQEAENTFERCFDGQDNDCDGKVDKSDEKCKEFCRPTDSPPPCYEDQKGNTSSSNETLNQGICRVGFKSCDPKTHKWGACIGAILPADKEECNKKDDDCDGNIDEDLPNCTAITCQRGEKRKCYTNLLGCPLVKGEYKCLGTCKFGIRECNEKGVWGACQQQLTPETETCDGYDNDCDGNIDEGCNCTDGQSQECFDGNKNVDKILICKKGIQFCKNGVWGQCLNSQTPQIEECNGLDDDCDGIVDNPDKMIRPLCSKQLGVCRSSTKVCGGSSGWLPCFSGTYQSWDKDYTTEEKSETCDNKDNDCDGLVDENCISNCTNGQTKKCYSFPEAPNTADVGLCRSGIQFCADGKWGDCLLQVTPTKEVCDNKDNDCDGQVDETFTNKGDACSVGKGECKRNGVYVCTNDEQSTSCSAQPGSTGVETCDGKDNDCDGNIDENVTCPGGTICVQGVCIQPGPEPSEETYQDAGTPEKTPELPPELPTDKSCSTDNDCPSPLVCRNTKCVPECRNQLDCTGGKLCDVNTQQCVLCQTSEDCCLRFLKGSTSYKLCTTDLNLACLSQQCVIRGCRRNSDCSSGKICDLKTFQCRSCQTDTECPSGQKCRAGVCYEGCTKSADCPTISGSQGQCVNGVCFAGCQRDTDCQGGFVCVSGSCKASVTSFQSALRYVDGSSAKSCTHYRFPQNGYHPATTSGVYWINPDGTKDIKVYCEMTLNRGGWTRFWWFSPGASMSGVTDVLSQNLAQCAPTDKTCFAKLPWSDPVELMTSSDQKSGQIYWFDNTNTSKRVLASLTTQAKWPASNGIGSSWPPVLAAGTLAHRTTEVGPQAGYWWYGLQNGVLSFSLDNNADACQSFFAAGMDQDGKLGVDHASTSCPSPNNTQNGLYLYARLPLKSPTLVLDNGARKRSDGTYEKSCLDYRFPPMYSGAVGDGDYWIQTNTSTPPQKVNCQMSKLVCVPSTCSSAGANCGEIFDGCGGKLKCGSCSAPYTCGGAGKANVCGCDGKWRIGSAESQGYSGIGADLKLDASGRPHMSHFNNTNKQLKYVHQDSTGVWRSEVALTLSNVSTSSSTGLGLDTKGGVHIAYYDGANLGAYIASKPKGGTWTKETIAAPQNYRNTGRYIQMGIDNTDTLHVAYYTSTSGTAGDLIYATKQLGGTTWSKTTIEQSININHIGMFVEPTGHVHLSYGSHANTSASRAKYAVLKKGGTWSVEVIDGTITRAGSPSSVFVDGNGTIHVAFKASDSSNAGVYYSKKLPTGTWTTTRIDTNVNASDPSVAVDTKGTTHVVYRFPNQLTHLYLQSGATQWTKQTIDTSTNNNGYNTHIAVDATGGVHVQYRDSTYRDLRYALLPNCPLTP